MLSSCHSDSIVDWDYKIYLLHFCRGGKTPPPTKWVFIWWRGSNPEALENVEYSFTSLLLLPSPHWLGAVVPIMVPSMGQIECLIIYLTWNHFCCIGLFVLNSNTLNYLTECKQMSSGSFKNIVTYKLFIYKSYIFNIQGGTIKLLP